MVTNTLKFCRYAAKLTHESAYSNPWVCKQQVPIKIESKSPNTIQEKQSKAHIIKNVATKNSLTKHFSNPFYDVINPHTESLLFHQNYRWAIVRELLSIFIKSLMFFFVYKPLKTIVSASSLS